MQEMIHCPVCKSTNMEKFSNDHYMCKDCGIGNKGHTKDIDREKYMQTLIDLVKYEKLKHPELTQNQLGRKVQDILHDIEKHPVSKDDYCEYCERIVK